MGCGYYREEALPQQEHLGTSEDAYRISDKMQYALLHGKLPFKSG